MEFSLVRRNRGSSGFKCGMGAGNSNSCRISGARRVLLSEVSKCRRHSLNGGCTNTRQRAGAHVAAKMTQKQTQCRSGIRKGKGLKLTVLCA